MPVISARRGVPTRGRGCELPRAAGPGSPAARHFPYPRPAPMPSTSATSGQPAGADRGATVVAPPTADLLGVPVALTDYAGAMDWMDAMVAARERGYVCVAAVHTIMASQ